MLDFSAGSPVVNEVVLGTSVEMGKRKGRSCYTSGNSYRVLQQRLTILRYPPLVLYQTCSRPTR
jgi:hypothetical protein